MNESEINERCAKLPAAMYRFAFSGGKSIRNKDNKYIYTLTGVCRTYFSDGRPFLAGINDEQEMVTAYCPLGNATECLAQIADAVAQAEQKGYINVRYSWADRFTGHVVVEIATIGDVPESKVRKLAIRTAATECRKLLRRLGVEYRKVTAVLRKGDAVRKYRRSK